MPQPGEAFQTQPSIEDSYSDLLAETLENLEDLARGQFLRQFFRTIAQIDLTETQANEYWERILSKRRELAESIGKQVSLKTAIVDVLASASFLRVPILMEYDKFKKLQINAATDALTGLYNRRLFDEYCDKELNRAKRYGHQLAVVILDVHKLKEVNDRHGHLQGDQVLQLAAATLRKTLRASDFAFRIGGDEFALLLPQTDSEQATTLCRRVRAQYEGDVQSLKLEPGVTLDFGVAVQPQDGEQKSALMGLADDRLYQLKRSSRTTLRVIPIDPHASSEAAVHPPQETAADPSRQASVASRETPAHPRREVVTPPSPQETFVPPETASLPHPPAHAVQRKWERVSLAGTKAYAVLTDMGQKTANVLDLSYGGVALLLPDNARELPDQVNAILHVPILPPVRVVLHKVYTQKLDGTRARVGCSFVS